MAMAIPHGGGSRGPDFVQRNLQSLNGSAADDFERKAGLDTLRTLDIS